MPEDAPPFEYDNHDLMPPKKARRGLLPETRAQIEMVTHYRKRCLVDPTLRHFTRLYAVNVASGNIAPYLRDIQKKCGKLPGLFDLVFLDKRTRPFRETWIEVKVGKNDYTPEQADFVDWLSDTPILCFQARTLNEFMAIIGA